MLSDTSGTIHRIRHNRATRLLHAGLGLAILTQLANSFAMQRPDEVLAGDHRFQVHRHSDPAARFLALGEHSAEPDGMIALSVHAALANLVRAYLIAHAGLSVMHHLMRSTSPSTMWSLGR